MAARKRSNRLGTRSLVAIGLVAFVFVTSIVVWRRATGVARAQEYTRLESKKRELLTERTTLESEIRAAMSNRRVVAEAERRLGLHVAADHEVRFIRRDARRNTDTITP